MGPGKFLRIVWPGRGEKTSASSYTEKKKPDIRQAFFLFVTMAVGRSVPAFAELFQKGEKLLHFLFGKDGEELAFSLAAHGFPLPGQGGAVVREAHVRGAAVGGAGAAADVAGGLQFFEDLAGRAGLYTQLLRHIPLGHGAVFLQQMENVVLGTFAVKVAAALMMELAEQVQEPVGVVHAFRLGPLVMGAVRAVLPMGMPAVFAAPAMFAMMAVFAVRIAVSMGGMAVGRQVVGGRFAPGIGFAPGAVGIIQRAAAAAAGADVGFIFVHSIHPYQFY